MTLHRYTVIQQYRQIKYRICLTAKFQKQGARVIVIQSTIQQRKKSTASSSTTHDKTEVMRCDWVRILTEEVESWSTGTKIGASKMGGNLSSDGLVLPP